MMLKPGAAPSPFRHVAAGNKMLDMPRVDETIIRMTLGNMRSLGVRRLFATCLTCHLETTINVDAWPDDVEVPSFGPRMRCMRCGHLGATAIPKSIGRRERSP